MPGYTISETALKTFLGKCPGVTERRHAMATGDKRQKGGVGKDTLLPYIGFLILLRSICRMVAVAVTA